MFSSDGRASVLHAEGHWFDPNNTYQKNIEKNLTFESSFGIMVVKDERLSNMCFRKWFPFGNVLVPATV